jgi:hypothetical protein
MYWAKQTRFPDGAIEFAVTKVPEARLRWLNNELPRKKWKVDLTQEEKRERSIRHSLMRTRQTVRHAVKTLGADHMVTLTYRENMQDIDTLKRDWQEYVRLLRAAGEDFQYVMVPELQERGAWHAHIAVKGRIDLDLHRRCWYRALGGTGKETGEDTPGAVNVKGPKKRWRQEGSHGLTWNANKLSAYLTKYISKTFGEAAKGAKRYWSSKGIKIDRQCYWLAATSFIDAVVEAYGRLEQMGNSGLDVRIRPDDGVIWLSASFRREQEVPF